MIDMKLKAQQSAEKWVRRLGNPSNLVFYYEYYVTWSIEKLCTRFYN